MNLNHDPFLQEILRQPPDFHSWVSQIHQQSAAGGMQMSAADMLRRSVFQDSQMEVACQTYAEASAGTMEEAMLQDLCGELQEESSRMLLALHGPDEQQCVMAAVRDALFRAVGTGLVRHPYFRPLLIERFGDDHPHELREEVRSLLTRWHAETFGREEP